MDENTKKELILEGLCCANCAYKIETRVKNLPGVNNASMNFVNKVLTFQVDTPENISTVMEMTKNIINHIEPDVVIKERFKDYKNTQSKQQIQIKQSLMVKLKEEKNFVLLIIGAIFYLVTFFLNNSSNIKLPLYIVSFLLIGSEVLIKSFKNIINGEVFDENFLMSIASIGALAIKQYPEAVGVMLFYQIGEFLQNLAVDSSRKSIKELMNIKPDFANLKLGTNFKKVDPNDVNVGDIIIIKPGEKVPLDGRIIEGKSLMDTSNLTGESVPKEVIIGSTVLSGFINISGLLTVVVEKVFENSSIAKILELVENASSKKANAENFITKFARYYTPIVTFSAMALAFIPPLIIPGASFSSWLYRALIFLVISCPCALVISVPLGFFSGIGVASKMGILVKGSNYLEALNDTSIVVFDKTGTLTKGVFKVTKVYTTGNFVKSDLLQYVAFAESYSNHPIATSIVKYYNKPIEKNQIDQYTELSGYGVSARVMGENILAGNSKLMDSNSIDYTDVDSFGSVIHIAFNKIYAGYIVISDEVKNDSKAAIKALKEIGIKKIVMLTGDTKKVATMIGAELGIDEVYSELLPQEKVQRLENLYNSMSPKKKLIFVGDGINDAPVLSRADIGIAMGGLGSDAAIEASDIVIMNDEPSKLVTALKIASKTKHIVVQNIVFALSIKIILLVFGALGFATMWEAVFGDVGVALIAVLNSMRVLHFRNS
jgi:Cd2+/Zn2+-exporting ATPase